MERKEREEIFHRYGLKIGELIGKGHRGEVFKGVLPDGREVAVKFAKFYLVKKSIHLISI